MIIQAIGDQPLFYQSQSFENIAFRLGLLDWADRMVDCVFYGRYEGTQFGYWTESLKGRPCPWGDIAIKGCDFSRGVFQGCLLSRADVDSIRFPKWPHFTVLFPSANNASWIAAELPF